MTEPRRASLLDFAIAASVAVVPVLLAVLLGLGELAPFAQSGIGDSHASARQVAALQTFERGIVRRDTVRSEAPGELALLDRLPECAAEWSDGARALDRVKRLLGMRPDGMGTPARRIASHLAALDEALLRISAAGNRRVADPVGFDLARWSEAARSALRTPVASPLYPDRRFDVRCDDLAAAAAMLSRGGGRMLAALAWRGSEVERTVARWHPDQYVAISPRHVARTNPWAVIG
jgi:hypothetical protein